MFNSLEKHSASSIEKLRSPIINPFKSAKDMIKNQGHTSFEVAGVSSDHLKLGRDLVKFNLFFCFNSMKYDTIEITNESLPGVENFFGPSFSHQVHPVSTDYSKSL